jgi:Endonuclease/Exonuclease/phosphatase family
MPAPVEFQALTANLGCGGPHRESRRQWAEGWLSSCGRQHLDLLFLQEVPPEAAARLGRDYQVMTDDGPRPYPCRSVVAARRASGLKLDDLPIESAPYHGSYVAGAVGTFPTLGRVALLSVHASPNEAKLRETALWECEEPARRNSGGELWDSDYALATAWQLVRQQDHVLAAGDWNEARRWDDTHGGTWGKDFFRSVEDAGLVDCAFRDWEAERATHGEYQDDHVFATSSISDRIGDLDCCELAPDGAGTDHLAIRFSVRDAP